MNMFNKLSESLRYHRDFLNYERDLMNRHHLIKAFLSTLAFITTLIILRMMKKKKAIDLVIVDGKCKQREKID